MADVSLKCGDCGALLKSVEEAQGHAKLTSHSNFFESTEAILNLERRHDEDRWPSPVFISFLSMKQSNVHEDPTGLCVDEAADALHAAATNGGLGDAREQ
ncbi:hypothetical protein NL676_002949 [Syzygium grande]|nr:hypothetical protein NL676_002949 [Syzygium grande]